MDERPMAIGEVPLTTDITERAKNSLAIALDETDLDYTLRLAKRLAPYAAIGKIGSVPFHANGTPTMVQAMVDVGLSPWVDWKGKEIDSIMAKTIKVLARQGVKIVTFHATSSPKTLREVSAAIAEVGSDMLALGVTILTTDDDDDVKDTYLYPTVEQMVKHLAIRTAVCGLGGMVSAPRDLPWLHEIEDPKLRELVARLIKHTPAIRPLWSVANDQKRPTTPRDAILAGSNVVVVGRPILEPPPEIGSPERAAELVLIEIEEAYQELDERNAA
jgi:orotidine-5'-phosphate decarboxylase